MFREIRKLRGFPLGATASGIISTQALLNFEKNGAEISLAHFMALLDRINVDFTEFQRSMGENINSNEMMAKLVTYWHDDDYYQLSQLIEQVPRNHPLLKTVIQIALAGLGVQKQVSSQKIEMVVDYLLRVEVWGQYEYRMFTVTQSIFSVQQLKLLCSQLFDYPKLVANGSDSWRAVIDDCALSVSDRLIKLKDYQTASQLLQSIQSGLQTDQLTTWILVAFDRARVKMGLNGTQEAAAYIVGFIAKIGDQEMANLLYKKLAEGQSALESQ